MGPGQINAEQQAARSSRAAATSAAGCRRGIFTWLCVRWVLRVKRKERCVCGPRSNTHARGYSDRHDDDDDDYDAGEPEDSAAVTNQIPKAPHRSINPHPVSGLAVLDHIHRIDPLITHSFIRSIGCLRAGCHTTTPVADEPLLHDDYLLEAGSIVVVVVDRVEGRARYAVVLRPVLLCLHPAAQSWAVPVDASEPVDGGLY